MPTDPLTGARYPAGTDVPNVAQYIQNAVTDLSDNSWPYFTTATLRDAAYTTWVNAGNTMRTGLHCSVLGVDYAYSTTNPTGWVQIGTVGSWSSFTPTWTAASAAPSTGNGSLTGWATRFGRTCHFQIELRFGSTTTGGTGAWTFTNLPYSAATTREQIVLVKGYTNGDYNFAGFGLLNGTAVIPYLPFGTANGNMFPVRNADATAAQGTGIPQINSAFAFSGTPTTPPRNLSIFGTYEIA